MDPIGDALTPDEAAQLLKLSKKTLLRHAPDGRVPGTKLGRVWRFRRSDLLALLSQLESS